MEFLNLFWEYFKIGLFTIGGGYAMLPMIKQVVENNNWMTYDELIAFIGIAESTPGPFAISLATFIGTEVGNNTPLGLFGGFLGAVTATFAVVLPSLVIVIIVIKLLDKFKQSKYVRGALYGIRPVVAGLILSSVVGIIAAVILPDLRFKNLSAEGFDTFNYVSLILLFAIFPLSKVKFKGKKIHPVFLILFSAVLGVLLFGVAKIHL